jgi:hypothetical protein
LRQPSLHGTSAYCPASAAARKQHDERYAGTQPDRSLHREVHFVPPFVVLVFPGYRVLLRDRRRFNKSIIIAPAAIQMPACMIVSLIVCALLCVSPYRFHHWEEVLEYL